MAKAWIDEEWILTYGYYLVYGKARGSKNYLQYVALFSSFQDRDIESSMNSFKRKIENYQAYFGVKYNTKGGLDASKKFHSEFKGKEEWVLKEFVKLAEDLNKFPHFEKPKDLLAHFTT